MNVPISAPERQRPPLIRNIKAISMTEEIPAMAPTSDINDPRLLRGSMRKMMRIPAIPPTNPDSAETRYPFLTTIDATKPESKTKYHTFVKRSSTPAIVTIKSEIMNPLTLPIFIIVPPVQAR